MNYKTLSGASGTPVDWPLACEGPMAILCLNSRGALIDMRGLDRFIAFDAESGIYAPRQALAFRKSFGFACRKDGSRRQLQEPASSRWAARSPMTFTVRTIMARARLDAMFARSGFCAAIADGKQSPLENDPALFASTIGGLGLTGVIEWVELQLVKIGGAYLDVEIVPYDSLDAFWSLAEESVQRFEHTVAWIDCTSRGAKSGRGIFSRANWIADGVYDIHDDRTWKRIPFEAPGFALNRLTVGAFNNLYHRLNSAKAGTSRQHYAAFFYPLDAMLDWNRLYGRRGMLQYQCVIPRGNERDAIGALLDVITASGQASFLAVLKTFGDSPSPGLLSFSRAGATLALDFPYRGEVTLNLMAQLDAIVSEAGGALYPAKDGRMTSELFRRSFPRWEQVVRDTALSSDFWRRVAE